ncbi:DDE-type integrase/transposase/recombinase, partial [Modestobacter lapidis]|nr:DDE-type integrase/transposase/recombinase [Modestobacter lapidis]
NSCSFYLNDMFYGSALLQNSLYILNLETPIYNINTKRLKSNDLNPTYLWHCRLGHISEKRIQKLHSDGILSSFDFESFDVCESCLLGKMTKAPFTGHSERASELLALIHTDVCGPLSSTARGGYQYFITFTDDFSRYGYVYLMKHKSETFEKFKEFQNEVQNQLGKTIKALRSDRGGEYLSQGFYDHLKNCGIVSQLTPPGTPQLNGVSERRNRTLIYIVRSLMSHTHLPLSFWGYA